MKTEYQRALRGAAKELKSLDEKVHAMECQRAKLRQAIAILQSLLGQLISENQTLTDAMIDFVRGKRLLYADGGRDGRIARQRLLRAPSKCGHHLEETCKRKTIQERHEGGYEWAGIPSLTGKIDFRPVKSMLRLKVKADRDYPASKLPNRSTTN
jgi:hypothetical protein